MNPRTLLVALLVLGAALSPGCITFYGEAEVQARVLVTQDVGTQILIDEEVHLAEGASAMDALRAVADIDTTHGGAFVEAIEGIESQYPEEKIDWFFHVDSQLADTGAAGHTVEEGEVILFDHRSWERTMRLDHVLTGLERWPTDLEDPGFDREAFLELQSDEHEQAKLYASIDGGELTLLDPSGTPERTLQAPWLLAHAVAGPGDQPQLVLVASDESDEEVRLLVNELATNQPVGVGLALTPNQTLEVPTG